MRRSRRRRSAPEAGFTLLEVVLAFASLAMLTAIVYAAFNLGTRALEKGQYAVVTAQRLRVAIDIMIRQIKSIDAYPAHDRQEGAYWWFVGYPTKMEFVTAAGLQGGGGLVKVTYSVQDGAVCRDSPPCLVVTESEFFSPDTLGRHEQDRDERRAVLLDGFRNLSFEYWEPEPEERDMGGYTSKWDPKEHDTLPAAIRLSIDGLRGVDNDTFVQEIPINTFWFTSGGGDPDSALSKEPEPEGAGATPGATGAGAKAGGGKESDDEGSDESDDDSKEDAE